MKKYLLFMLLGTVAFGEVSTTQVKIKVEIVNKIEVEEKEKINLEEVVKTFGFDNFKIVGSSSKPSGEIGVYYYDYENETSEDITILSRGEFKSYPKLKVVKPYEKQRFIFISSSKDRVALYKNTDIKYFYRNLNINE